MVMIEYKVILFWLIILSINFKNDNQAFRENLNLRNISGKTGFRRQKFCIDGRNKVTEINFDICCTLAKIYAASSDKIGLLCNNHDHQQNSTKPVAGELQRRKESKHKEIQNSGNITNQVTWKISHYMHRNMFITWNTLFKWTMKLAKKVRGIASG